MNAIFLIGSVQAFFFSILIFSKKRKNFHDKILGSWILVMGLQILMKYIYFNDLYVNIPWILGLNAGFPLLHGPFLFLYINSLTKNYKRLRSVDFLHFIPFVILYITLAPLLFLDAETKINIFVNAQDLNNKYIPLFIMIILSAPAYIVWSLFSLKKHQTNILKFFSFNEIVGLRWLYYLTAGLGVVWLSIFLAYILTYAFDAIELINRDILIYVVFVTYVFIIGFKGFKQGSIFIDINPILLQTKEKYQADKIKTQKSEAKEKPIGKIKDADEILKKLKNYMNEEKPFLEEKLTIVQLSEAIKTPYYILSQIINEKLNQNFFDFINSYRVNEAKIKLCDPKLDHYTILGIALDCGFNSKASFNRIFKIKTSETPSQYRNAQEIS